MLRILLPTDFSKNSRKAIDFVYKHFLPQEVDLLLVHTIKAPHSATGVLIRIDDLMRKDAEVQMNQLVEEIKHAYGVSPKSLIKVGQLAEWVRQYSKIYNFDMIAMGTKGESDIASKLMGSVTESVIRTAKLPVLAIPSGYSNGELHHIAIATPNNQIERPEFLLSFIETLAHRNLKVNTLNVSKDERVSSPRKIQFANQIVGVDSVINSSVVQGINNYLETVKTDMLVMYHKKNSRMDYFFNRSITKTIAAKTSVPLLVIPHERN